MELLAQALERWRAGEAVALATVIHVSGSTPRHVGAKLAVTENGHTFGTIGGGRVELEVTLAAREVASGAPARRVRHHLVRDLAMCCGGSMELYVEPLAPGVPAIEQALACIDAREPAVLVTPLDGSPKQLVRARPSSRAPALEPGAHGERLVEPLWPRDRVILFGCGHVSRAIGPLAAGVGFEVALCDDDETGALADPPAWAARVVDSFDRRDVEAALGPLGDADYAVIVTRDHAVDQAILEQLLPEAGLAYLGLIGSLGKIGRFRKRLEAKGIATPERWARLSAPIGLDIGAETPEEIAVSVVAELIDRRRRHHADRDDAAGHGSSPRRAPG